MLDPWRTTYGQSQSRCPRISGPLQYRGVLEWFHPKWPSTYGPIDRGVLEKVAHSIIEVSSNIRHMGSPICRSADARWSSEIYTHPSILSTHTTCSHRNLRDPLVLGVRARERHSLEVVPDNAHRSLSWPFWLKHGHVLAGHAERAY